MTTLPQKPSSALLQIGKLLIVGFAFLLCISASEYLLVPQAIEPMARLFYRIVYFIVLPVRVLVVPFLPAQEHHWTVQHTVTVCMAAPFFYTLLWMGARSFYRAIRDLRDAKVPQDGVTRRQFLKTSTLSVSGVAFGGTGSYATLVEPQLLAERHYTLPIRDLPESLLGKRLIHVSDTHYGPFVSLDFLEKVVAKVNALDGDLVLLTGDYVHRSTKAIEPGISILQSIKSRDGVLAVLGNHDHWEGADDCRAMFERIGIPLVDNDRMYYGAEGITSTPSENTLCVAGVGDLWEDDVSFADALDGVPLEMPRLVLSHNPDTAEMIEEGYRVDAMFSGHTHGGQVRFPYVYSLLPSKFGKKYLGGLCEGPKCPVIVSRGVGLGGIPIRFRVAPEIGIVTLVRSQPPA